MIIDFHTHVFETSIVENRSKYFNDQSFELLYSSERSKLIDHKSMIKAMDESGVDYAVAMGFPWGKEDYCERQNRYFSKFRGYTGGRIIPFGSVPLNDRAHFDDWSLHVKELGLAGIGEIAFYESGLTYKNAGILEELLSSAMKHSLPVCLHVSEPAGHDYAGKHVTDFGILYSIIKNFPDLTLILAHMGGGLCFYELLKDAGSCFKNIYYDTAASLFIYKDDVFDIVARIIGTERILFGSDYPLINFKRYFAVIDKAVNDEIHRKKIYSDNAIRIIGSHLNIHKEEVILSGKETEK